MAISKAKRDELAKRMKRLEIREEDLLEKFILSSGRGGQKVNKTASAVYLKHLPSGIEVKCGKDRSQEINRFFARRQLCEKLEKHLYGLKTPSEIQAEKTRKQKKRRKRRQLDET